MDGHLWLWPAGGSAGIDIPAAHAAPVSKMACLTSAATATAAGPGNTGPRGRGASSSSRAATAAAAGPVLAASCSYDKTVKIWDVTGSRGKQAAVLTGHSGPVLELAVNEVNSIIATGTVRAPGRTPAACMWSAAGTVCACVLSAFSDQLVLSGWHSSAPVLQEAPAKCAKLYYQKVFICIDAVFLPVAWVWLNCAMQLFRGGLQQASTHCCCCSCCRPCFQVTAGEG